MATEIHAEHVGSLLRPGYLLDARARHRRKLALVTVTAADVWG
jgi:methionine synthase II (cobalamin-independent)